MDTDNKQNQTTEEEELAAYQKLRQRLSKILGELNDTINTDSISQAMDKALAELKALGDHSREAISKAGKSLQKDIASTAEQLKPTIDEVSGDARKRFDDWREKGGALWRDLGREAEYYTALSRDKGGAFLLNVTRGLSDWSQAMNRKLGSSLTYRTGELTHGGQFVCTGCDAKLNLKQPGRLPPCPKCRHTEFRRA